MTGLNDIPNDPTLIVESLRLSRCVLGPSRALSHPSHLQRQQARLRDLQAQLQHQFLHPIQRVPLGPTAIPLAVRQAFMRAALLVTRYRTVSGAGWQSTMQSFTLDQYEADPIPNELTAPEAIASLCQHFQLPPEDRQQLEQLLQDLDARIDSQGRVIRAVLADVGLVSFDDDASTIVFMSSFCAEDGFSSFWWLDDVLARYFLPCRQILKQWFESSSNSC
ncbi:MAG: hypothetical protein AAF978_10265 [Cyanobacteria bacterium P01_E01_bin.48]